MDDVELLGRFAENGDQAAFRELVQRYLDFAYSAARRQVGGDSHLAAEVVQEVFREIARQADRLRHLRSLTGWIYSVTRNKARMSVRSHRRWQKREQEANAMTADNESSAPHWSELAPILDEVVHELDGSDREAILLRYFEDRPIAEVAAKLGVAPDTARRRVERSLDRLRDRLARRGITSTATALGLVLAAQAGHAAPPGVAGVVCGVVLSAPMSVSNGSPLLDVMKMVTKQKITVATAFLLLGVVGAILFEKQVQAEVAATERREHDGLALLRGDVRLLRQELQAQTLRPGQQNISAAEAALVRLRHLESLLDRGFLTEPGPRNLALLPFVTNSGEDLNPRMAAVFGLSPENFDVLSQAYLQARKEIADLAKADGQVAKHGFSSTPEMLRSRQRMREVFREILGSERYHYYVRFGCEANEVLSLFHWTISQRS